MTPDRLTPQQRRAALDLLASLSRVLATDVKGENPNLTPGERKANAVLLESHCHALAAGCDTWIGSL